MYIVHPGGAGTGDPSARAASPVADSAITVTRRAVPSSTGTAVATGTATTRSVPSSRLTTTGSGVVTPGPSARTVTGPEEAPGTSVTRGSWSGRCVVPPNRSVERTSRICKSGCPIPWSRLPG
jgi:hypothetical protein